MNKVRIPFLDKETISEIAYAMENQDIESVINVRDWHVYPSENLFEFFDDINDDDFITAPEWTSADGYRLMCAFAHECQNPTTKRALEHELEAKQRGVFRRFRCVLDQDEQSLKSWYEFKDRKLASYVRSWLSDLAKSRPELFRAHSQQLEGDDLPAGALLADFDMVFVDDAMCNPEISSLVESSVSGLKCKVFDSLGQKKAFAVYKESKLCGVLIYIEENDEAAILFYHVIEECREFGLFSLMLDALNRALERDGVEKVFVMMPGSCRFLRGKFSSFDVATTSEMEVLSYNTSDWNEAVPSMETAYVL